MPNLQNFQAKLCYTASGMLIHEGKVLLVKHKKLGIWLNPGGHIEANELNHRAAEREFFEETGVRVKAIDLTGLLDETQTEFLPNPISTNLHWVSKENYWARVQNKGEADAVWKKGCEQHINFMYLVYPVAGVETKFDAVETLDIKWFTLDEVETMDIPENIRQEIRQGFQIKGELEKMKQVM